MTTAIIILFLVQMLTLAMVVGLTVWCGKLQRYDDALKAREASAEVTQ